jgi:carboxylesterase type B
VLAFATHADPGWERYELTRRRTRRIDVRSETIDDPEHDVREIWAQV